MTMDQLYLTILIVLAVAVVVRFPSFAKHPEARPAWIATALALPALFSRGAVIPIDTLDGLLGGENIIFLIQCWCTTFAAWAMGEAARFQENARPPKLNWGVPLLLCLPYTIPFFFIQDRSPTELFFIDAHVDDPAAIICGGLYMAGIAAICVQLLWRLRRRKAWPYWLLRTGAVLLVGGSLLWSVAIVIDYLFALDRDQIIWMYYGFDLLFYPGVVILAAGLLAFAIQRQLRHNRARRRMRTLRAIASNHGLKLAPIEGSPPYQLFDALVQVQDLQHLGWAPASPQDESEIRRIDDWLKKIFPQFREVEESLTTGRES